MKNLFLSFFTLFLLISCSRNNSTVNKTGLSEQDLISGFKNAESKFKKVFESPQEYDQAQLKPLNDSLAYFVDGLLAEFPKSAELPKVLIEAGIKSLNVKNGKKALQYLAYVVDSFPKHKVVPRAMYFIGRTKDVVLNDVDGAKKAYKRLYRAYPNSIWGQNAKSSVKLIIKPNFFQEIEIDEQDSIDFN